MFARCCWQHKSEFYCYLTRSIPFLLIENLVLWQFCPLLQWGLCVCVYQRYTMWVDLSSSTQTHAKPTNHRLLLGSRSDALCRSPCCGPVLKTLVPVTGFFWLSDRWPDWDWFFYVHGGTDIYQYNHIRIIRVYTISKRIGYELTSFNSLRSSVSTRSL